MRILILIGIFIATNAFSSGVPTMHKITPENATTLGFDLSEIIEESMKAGVLKYPKSIDGYIVARVQTSLSDLSGHQVTVTSADAVISDDSPSLLFAFSSDLYDMNICIQYGRIRDGVMYYDRSYCIDSVSNYLITS